MPITPTAWLALSQDEQLKYWDTLDEPDRKILKDSIEGSSMSPPKLNITRQSQGSTGPSPEEELRTIIDELKRKHPKKDIYLTERRVAKTFYLDENSRSLHYSEEISSHAKTILTSRQENRKLKLFAAEQVFFVNQRKYLAYAEELSALVANATSYFDLDLSVRSNIDELEDWIRSFPVSEWTGWHFETMEFLAEIPNRAKAISLAKPVATKSKREIPTKLNAWEYTAIIVTTHGTNAGVISALQNKGLDNGSFSKIEKLGQEGWEIVAACPLVSGVMGASGTPSIALILKRPKAESESSSK